MNMSENNNKDLKIQSNLNLYNFIKGMIYEGIYDNPMPENMNVKLSGTKFCSITRNNNCKK